MTKSDGLTDLGFSGILAPSSKWNHIKPWNRHGLILLTAGFAYILIGIAFMLSEETPIRRENLRHMLSLMPFDWWCVGFVIVGVLSILSSRWPSKPRTLGYSALTGWTVLWSGLYIFGGLSDPLHWGYVAIGLGWGMLGFLWWAVSGLISPPSERGSRGSCASPYRHCARSYNSGLGCDLDTTTSIESQPKFLDRSLPFGHGEGSIRASSDIRHRDDHTSEPDDRRTT